MQTHHACRAEERKRQVEVTFRLTGAGIPNIFLIFKWRGERHESLFTRKFFVLGIFLLQRKAGGKRDGKCMFPTPMTIAIVLSITLLPEKFANGAMWRCLRQEK